MVMLQWRQLVITGRLKRRANERIIETDASLVPPPGVVVTLRVPGPYCGFAAADHWIVMAVEPVDGSFSKRRITVRRQPFFASA